MAAPLDSKQTAEVTIRTAKPSDFTEIFNFLRRNFFEDEPLNFSIGFLKGEPTCVQLEAFCKENLEKQLSFVAELDGRIAGVILNSVLERPKDSPEASATVGPPQPVRLSDSIDAKFGAIEGLMGRIAQSIDFFKRYPDVDSIYNVEILSVERDLQGRGIAKKLLAAFRLLAVERKIPLILCMCSSHYSALAVKRLGYQCIHEVPYSEYKDSTGKPVFAPAPPHRSMAVYVYPVQI